LVLVRRVILYARVKRRQVGNMPDQVRANLDGKRGVLNLAFARSSPTIRGGAMERYVNELFRFLTGPFGWMGMIAFVVILILIVRGPSNPRP
jgi:hypothetical protein